MRVILLQDVPNVGRKNEVKDVREGFGRNFLLPQKLAMPATKETVEKIAREALQKEEHQHALERKYREIAEMLKNITLAFTMKVGEKGKAFGSVSEQDIMAELTTHGIEIEKSWIALDGHIKTTGTHTVPIKFPYEIRGEVKVVVEAEE